MNFHSTSLRFLSLSALAAACILATGCRSRNPMPTAAEENTLPLPGTQPIPQPQQNAPARPPKAGRIPQVNANLPVTLTTDKAEYGRGDTLRFTITVRNASAEPQKLSFTSGQNFDIIARRADAKDAEAPEVWRWASDKIFTLSLRAQTLRPSEELSFSATWDQTTGDTRVLPRGTYILSAEIASNPRLPSPPITVNLVN